MGSYSNEKVEPEDHFVVHIRVEKVTRYVNRSTSLASTTETRGKDVEDVINVVKKSQSLVNAIEFTKDTLDLVVNEESV